MPSEGVESAVEFRRLLAGAQTTNSTGSDAKRITRIDEVMALAERAFSFCLT